jgi:hypothetical protein
MRDLAAHLANTTPVSVLLTNAIAILSEDRFLARIGWSASSNDAAFGAGGDQSVKTKIVNLIASVRTLMRSTLPCSPKIYPKVIPRRRKENENRKDGARMRKWVIHVS